MRSTIGQYQSIVVRLCEILGQYPFGTAIFRELLQNADDSGATRLVIFLDSRSGLLGMDNDNLGHDYDMGPALVVFNDARFRDADFKSIRSIGVSSKRDDLNSTGKFGIGFNATYHLTDTPWIVSGETVLIFDPAKKHGKHDGALEDSFSSMAHNPMFEACFKPFVEQVLGR